MRSTSPFQAMARHNATYRYLRRKDGTMIRRDEEDLASLSHKAERLATMVRCGAPQDSIVNYAQQVRHHAERLGIMIHIPA